MDRYGPRNIYRIAKELGLPRETVRYRVKNLISSFSLEFHLNIYHTYLGLKKAFVFADATPGFEDVLFNCMKANDFWVYIGRYYGRFEGCYGIYTVPAAHSEQFEEFVNQLGETGITQRIRLKWSTCLQSVNLKEKWFKVYMEKGSFPWDRWIDEIPKKNPELPPTLKEPKDFPIKADEKDLYILAELEIDSTKRLREIAKTLGLTPETVSYHYKNHILKRGLIEKSSIFFFRFDKAVSDFFVFIFRFSTEEKMAKFASSLLDKPFVYSLGKIMGENGLIAHIYLPREEFRKFIEALSKLIKRGFLDTYEYLIEDYAKSQAQTISFEYFKDGVWIYDHKRHLENLKKELMKLKNLRKH